MALTHGLIIFAQKPPRRERNTCHTTQWNTQLYQKDTHNICTAAQRVKLWAMQSGKINSGKNTIINYVPPTHSMAEIHTPSWNTDTRDHTAKDILRDRYKNANTSHTSQ